MPMMQLFVLNSEMKKVVTMTNFKLLSCFLYVAFVVEIQCIRNISKRSLFFPTTTVLQFTYGLSVPLTIDGAEEGTTILLSACLQGNYDLPKKSSDLQVHDLTRRDVTENEDLSKIDIYKYIVQYLDSLDFNGEECLARMVCEIAKYPLDIRKDNHVLEKILHFVLTPSIGTSNEMVNEDIAFFSKLVIAEESGRRGDHCELKYSSCDVSIASLFTSYFVE